MRMPKRKRTDFSNNKHSLNNATEFDDLNEELFEQKFLDDNNDAELHRKTLMSFSESIVTNDVLSPIDNVKSLHSTTENNIVQLSPPANKYSNFRRKSNRILSLKKSNQVSQNVISSSIEESIVSANDSSLSTANFLENSKKPNELSTSDVSSTSSITSSVPSTSNQTKNISTANSGKSLRKIQVWTEDDIRWFFEALCEHGKDFPHIQAYIASRCEKKGIPPDLIKNYEQVRHYYYRLWHKILQMLKISDVIDKGVQELYGLINYGEIWKKFGAKIDSKLSIYLQQLVDYGHTVFKVKGKTVRVKTPICNALKRIHNLKFKTNNSINKPISPPLPKDICVMLIPATISDWIHVHSLSQNPRLCTKMKMQQRLFSLIEYLERRWSLARIKNNTSRALLDIELFEQTNIESSQISPRDSCAPHFKIRLKTRASEKLQDKVALKSTTNSISCNNYRSTTHGNAQIDLSLSSYLKKLKDNLHDNKKLKMRKSTSKKPNQAETLNEIEEKASLIDTTKDDQIPTDAAKNAKSETQSIDLMKLLDSMNEELEVAENILNENKTLKSETSSKFEETTKEDTSENVVEISSNIEMNDFVLPEPPAHTTLAQWLAGEYDNNREVIPDDDEVRSERTAEITDTDNISKQSINSENKESKGRSRIPETVNLLTSDQARSGWTSEEAKLVTIENNDKEQDSEISLDNNVPNDEITSFEQNSTDFKNLPEQIGAESKPLTIMEKFLIAANLTLMNYKKQNVLPATDSVSPQNVASTIGANKSRKRPAKAVNSQLLSNLIQETILDDKDGLTVSNLNKNSKATKTKANDNKNVADNAEIKKETVQFVTPKSPAPRSQQQSLISKTKRTTTVLNDSVKVEEALKELKSNSSRRQRRPMHKPLMYNLQNKMIASNLTNGKHSAVLLITASHLNSGDGSSSKQILLSDLLSSHLPQASISVTPNASVSSTSAQSEQKAPTSVMIPLKVETKLSPNSENLPYNLKTNSTEVAPTVNKLICDISKNPIEYTNIEAVNFNKSLLEPSTSNAFPKFSNDEKSITNVNNVKMTEKRNIEPISNSQLSWLNDVNNDISIGSLFDTCDNSELTLNHKVAIDSSLGLTSDIDTHVNSLANDNSVDLMAKFADLAETISSDSKQY